MLLATAISVSQLQTLHAIGITQPDLPSFPNPLDYSPLPMPRLSPPPDNAHVRDISAHPCGELERFTKYASAAYQSVSLSAPAAEYSCATGKLRARLTFVGLFARSLGRSLWMFAVVLRCTV